MTTGAIAKHPSVNGDLHEFSQLDSTTCACAYTERLRAGGLTFRRYRVQNSSKSATLQQWHAYIDEKSTSCTQTVLCDAPAVQSIDCHHSSQA